jgi:ATP-dependent Lhr-like helicase
VSAGAPIEPVYPDLFHPAVRTWFERRFELGPTEPQFAGWPAIAAGHDTLIAAPTGSGKTLAAFLVCIDRFYRDAEANGSIAEGTDVVYVSPLKALAVDISQNLEMPLREIGQIAAELGYFAPDIRVAVRSGDTPASARAGMIKRPPHLLVTTPESLYLMVTAQRSRENLTRVRTLIVDEIHAVARDKRGSHLALTLERLEALCERRPVRIGLSATQKPIDTVARLLVGVSSARAEPATRPCTVIDLGHQRRLDLGIEVPASEIEAVASGEQWGEILDRIAELVASHRTTLVFTNTRRLTERIAHQLEERLGAESVAAHHGSLSKERRLKAENRLRSGDLAVLVATASLELGIDIGPVDLVCQLGSPRSLATFLQRVGRSGHSRGATPKGRLFPTTRDELVECAALLRGVSHGRLDRLQPPTAPLDILAQQIVAACGAEDWEEDELFALVRRSAPYAELSRTDFDDIVEMLSSGIETGRGRRAAYLHRDRVHRVLRGRRGARLAALTSGGAIPDTADYRVVADPDDTFVGTVNEDFAIESMAGDVFLLGSTSWRIRRVEAGLVRVTDAAGAPPSIPFWLGEAPARTAELSAEVSDLRVIVDRYLADEDPDGAADWLRREAGLDPAGAEQIVRYIAAIRSSLGVTPTQRDIVIERFFDETGGMQLVVHAPFGGRINRGFGLAVRKRICRSFDFELQAAANDDALVLSLGPQHSFPLEDFAKMLSSRSVAETLSQAALASPMFTARWRWNLGRSLAILRFRGGRKNPPPIQRMEADDLMAAIFPSLAACQENVTGPIVIPDHPLVRQTLHDCLTEAMDVAGLESLLRGLEDGSVTAHFRDTTEPSPAAHEILNGKPFTFLDNAPLEERRTRAVALRRGLPEDARDLGRLDAEAISRVREEAAPAPRDAEEVHDALLGFVAHRPVPDWRDAFQELVRGGRAGTIEVPAGILWFVVESRPAIDALFPEARVVPDVRLPEGLEPGPAPSPDEAGAAVIRGHLESAGPCTIAELAAATAFSSAGVEQAAARLEASGFLLRGHFDPQRSEPGIEQYCARHLLARIHRYTQERLRKEIEPVSAQDFLRFLLRWQHVTPDTRREGRRGLLAAIEQLQGFQVPAGAWEELVLPARVTSYRAEWLDELCLSGEVVWGRLAPRLPSATASEPGRGSAPSRATPISLATREDFAWLIEAARGMHAPVVPGPGAARDLLEALQSRGALFHAELAQSTARLPIEVEEGLWELVSRGLVTADGFQSVRALLGAKDRYARRASRRRAQSGLRRRSRARTGAEGRWALLPETADSIDRDDLAEAISEQLLARWGVIFRDLITREDVSLTWRELLYALRRMEARGTIRGGRFVTGFVGEQYALPGAVDALRQTRRLERTGELVRVSGADPLNLVGILTPGPRVPALRTQRVIYRDGLPESAAAATG